MVAKGGYPLLEQDAMATLKTELLPQASLLTPNIAEAEMLSGISIKTLANAREAAKVDPSIRLQTCPDQGWAPAGTAGDRFTL